PFRTPVSVGRCITEFAAAVRGHHAALRVGDMDVRLKDHVHPASDGDCRVTGPQAAYGEMHGSEAGGAAGVNGQAGATEAKRMRDAARCRVPAAPERHRKINRLRVSKQTVLEVSD